MGRFGVELHDEDSSEESPIRWAPSSHMACEDWGLGDEGSAGDCGGEGSGECGDGASESALDIARDGPASDGPALDMARDWPLDCASVDVYSYSDGVSPEGA